MKKYIRPEMIAIIRQAEMLEDSAPAEGFAADLDFWPGL